MFNNHSRTRHFQSNKQLLFQENNINFYRKPRIKSAKKIIIKFGIPKAICYQLENKKLNNKKIKKINKKKKKIYKKNNTYNPINKKNINNNKNDLNNDKNNG